VPAPLKAPKTGGMGLAKPDVIFGVDTTGTQRQKEINMKWVVEEEKGLKFEAKPPPPPDIYIIMEVY